MVPDSSRRRNVTQCLAGAAVPKKRATAVDTALLVSFVSDLPQAVSFVTRGCHRGKSRPCLPASRNAGYARFCIAVTPTPTAHGSLWRWCGRATSSRARKRRLSNRTFRAPLGDTRSEEHNGRRQQENFKLWPAIRRTKKRAIPRDTHKEIIIAVPRMRTKCGTQSRDQETGAESTQQAFQRPGLIMPACRQTPKLMSESRSSVL